MRLFHSIVPITVGLFLAVTNPLQGWAEPLTDSGAARYIRALFDATLPKDGQGSDRWLLSHCADIAAVGRFAAGRLWQALSDAERQAFDPAFCDLASDAVARVRQAFPGLQISILESQSAPQDMVSVHSSVMTRDGRQWPVDWLVAGPDSQPHLADLRVLGISLGIFLRSLASLDWPGKTPESLASGQILHPWASALDRALPPADGAAHR